MPVHFDVKDHVARVTIDRPEVLNAVDAATERELETIWSSIEANRDVRAVVLTGAGERAFCTGADMKGGSGSSGLEYWAAARPNGFGGIALRKTLDVPVDRAGQWPCRRRRLRDGARLRHHRRGRRGHVQPAGSAGRAPAARWRHDAAAAADSVPCRHGHHADRTAGACARSAGAGHRQRGGAARCDRRGRRSLAGAYSGLRAAVDPRHQAGGAPDAASDALPKRRDSGCRRWSRRWCRRIRPKASGLSWKSASRSGKAAETV